MNELYVVGEFWPDFERSFARGTGVWSIGAMVFEVRS